jgi:hypothetical protein
VEKTAEFDENFRHYYACTVIGPVRKTPADRGSLSAGTSRLLRSNLQRVTGKPFFRPGTEHEGLEHGI